MAAIGTRKLKLEVDGDERNAEITTAKLTTAESDTDTLTFAEAEGDGGNDWFLNIVMLQDAATGTLWTEVWDNSGDDIPFTFMPYGNAVATTAEPHFEGIATIKLPDGDVLGTEANRSSTARATVEVSWKCLAKPTKVTA